MRSLLRIVLIAADGAWAALGGESDVPAPRQSHTRHLAQACRTICVEELNACLRTCDNAAIRIDCQSQCQTRFNLCTWNCR